MSVRLMALHRRRMLEGYLHAKRLVKTAGFWDDIEWAEGLTDVRPDAMYVVRETAWVILNSGFRYQVARKLWPALTSAFCGWQPGLIALIPDRCVADGLLVLKHPKKIRAMAEIACLVHKYGHEAITRDAADPPKLRRLPHIGPITCYHLAKVLGADVVKPDVHLTRAAKAAGYSTPRQLCSEIRDAFQPLGGERLAVIDSVLWRYGEQRERRQWPSWSELWAGEGGSRSSAI